MRSIFFIACMMCIAFAADNLYYKRLAGSPSEFDAYVLPTPQMNAQTQSSASYFIHYESESKVLHKLKATEDLYVDSTVRFMFTLFSPILDSLKVTLVDPNGKKIKLEQYASPTFWPIGDHSVNGTAYVFESPMVGKYKLTLNSKSLDKKTYDNLLQNSIADGFIIVFNQDGLASHTYLASYNLFPGSQVGVITRATEEAISVSEMHSGRVPKASEHAENAVMLVVYPNGTRIGESMHDDGLHNDGEAHDGVFGAFITPDVEGQYIIQATIRGTAASGAHFERTTDQYVPVINRDATLSQEAFAVPESSGPKMKVLIGMNAGSVVRQYRAYAEVWGKDANGADVAICWIGGMTVAEKDSNGAIAVPLQLDLNWVSRIGASEPFTLKNIIIQDPITALPFDTAAQIPVKTINLQATMRSLAGKLTSDPDAPITESMTMGERPAAFQQQSSNVTATNAPVVVVHGYCSTGDPFAHSPQITNAIYFMDPNQNVDVDTFARRVLANANVSAAPAFSWIAHSQGGMVGLQVSQFYWSGLDRVSGGRILQSIGTPYQGCSGAGTAASIIKVFGTGCGANNDLTTDGAALRLASYSPATRAQAYYYTATYKLGTFWGDYCNLAANAVLKWPNDGTCEKDLADLPSGNFMGNTEQECHSTGMKYMPECTDATRNLAMSRAAARTY